MTLTAKVFKYISAHVERAFVLQIGAMDGITFDDARTYLDRYRFPALLVEPMPDRFEELVSNFSDRDNYIYEQSAVANEDGITTMLTIPSSVIEKEGLHPGYKGMSALYPLKNGFASKKDVDIEVRDKFAVNVEVEGITLKSLLDKHEIKRIDVFLCDAEGFDWNVFNQLDLTKFRPLFLRLEHMNLTSVERELMRKKLRENGYEIIEGGKDIDAVDKTVFEEILTGTDGE